MGIYDKATERWLDSLPIITRFDIQFTAAKCEACGKFYKSSLEHKCEKKRAAERPLIGASESKYLPDGG